MNVVCQGSGVSCKICWSVPGRLKEREAEIKHRDCVCTFILFIDLHLPKDVGNQLPTQPNKTIKLLTQTRS